MKKYESLRGTGSFDRVFATGSRAQGSHIRCVYRFRNEPGSAVRIGFAVPRHSGKAFLRNRIRRLMREAVARTLKDIVEPVPGSVVSLEAVLVYKSGKGCEPRRLTLVEVEEDMAKIFRQIANAANRFHA